MDCDDVKRNKIIMYDRETDTDCHQDTTISC